MWILRDHLFSVCCFNQRHIHIKRQVTQHALPAQLAWRCGKMNWSSVRWGKTVLGRLQQPRQDTIFCAGTTNPTNQPRKEPFHLYSLRPIPPFQLSAWAAPIYRLSGLNASLHALFWQFTILHCLLFCNQFSSFLIFSIPLNNYN